MFRQTKADHMELKTAASNEKAKLLEKVIAVEMLTQIKTRMTIGTHTWAIKRSLTKQFTRQLVTQQTKRSTL